MAETGGRTSLGSCTVGDEDLSEYHRYAEIEGRDYQEGVVQHLRTDLFNALIWCERCIEIVLLAYLRVPESREAVARKMLLERMALSAKIDGLKAVIAALEADEEFGDLAPELKQASLVRNRLAHDVVSVDIDPHESAVVLERLVGAALQRERIAVQVLENHVEACNAAAPRLSRLAVLAMGGDPLLAQFDASARASERALMKALGEPSDPPF